MNQLQSLTTLIATLTSTEKNHCRHFLKTFSSTGNKSLKLFELLEKPSSKQIKETDLCMKLYGKRKSNSFVRLLHRLQEKILGIISSEQNVQHEISDTKLRNQILLRHRMNHADVLFEKNLSKQTEIVLTGIIQTANHYELFDELLAGLRLYEQIALKQYDFEKGQQMSNEMIICRQKKSVISTASHILMMMKYESKIDFTERLRVLNEYASEVPSATYSFLLLGIKVLQMQLKHDYNAADELLKQRLALASDHPAVKDKQCIGEIYLELAKNSIQLSLPENAKKYLFDAEHYLKTDSLQEAREQIRKSIKGL
jgi:hypothetical protein